MKNFYFLFVLFLAALYSFGQDPLFTNPQQSLVYLNPSFAGSNGLVRSQSLFRNQWYNSSLPYVTFYSGVDFFLKPAKSGIAVTYFHDDIGNGLLKTKTLALTYSKYFSFLNNELRIIPSIQIGYLHKELNRTLLRFRDPIAGRYSSYWNISEPSVALQSKQNIDFSSGLLINYKSFYFGTSVFHINQPNTGLLGDEKLPYRLSVHSSTNYRINGSTLLNLFMRYEQQQNFNNLQFRANMTIAKYVFYGLGCNTDNVGSFNLGYRNNFFSLGVGYDKALSSNKSNSIRDSWEAQLSTNIRDKEQRKSLTDFEKW